ncbi:MAG: putative bifunctional diguanylate cyclase/phosphodiesterase [Negativicutes bacterium]
MERVSKNEFGGAVFFIDIDDFKIVNEKFGHTCGNQVIAQFGANIAAALGENCIVARIGGDEFVAVLQGVENGCKAEELAAHLSGRIGRDYELGMSMFRLTASIGIALYPKDGDAVDRILKNADMALYEAKKRGKNTWLLFDYDLAKATYEGIALKQGLRKAIERGELRLEFQPLVESTSYRIVSFEALLRWQSDEFGLVPPDKFIPLAEECGEIKLIGKWVIREACAFACRLQNLGRADVHVTVNVSPRQLATEDFVPFLMGEVSDAGINANQLEIEITENALIGSMAESVEKLEILREAGIGLLLDDFGIGYSSLAYLKSLPVSIVKIDKTFIDEIVTSAAELRFVQAIIYMAHGQNLCVAAEGVETENQVNALRDCGCDYIQGYFFSRPISADAAMSLLVSDW